MTPDQLQNVGDIDRKTYRRSTPGKLERRASDVLAMYCERGMTQQEIADALDVTQRAVKLFMKRHNIPQRPQIKRDQRAERNDSWKGDSVGYKAAHQRVYRARGRPQKCEKCGTTSPAKRYHWASISRKYHDPSDYMRLCSSCHFKHDGLVRNLGHYAKGASHAE